MQNERKLKDKGGKFTTAIKHKLNTKLKPNELYGIKLYPLYVEVRAKRQVTVFKSRFGCYVREDDFDTFLRDPLIKEMLYNEKRFIEEHLVSDLYDQKDDLDAFSLSSWYKKYSDHIEIRNWARAFSISMEKPLYEAFEKNNLSEHQIDVFFPEQTDILYIIQLLDTLKVPGFEHMSSKISFFSEITVNFLGFERARSSSMLSSNKPQWQGMTNIHKGLIPEDLWTPFFVEYCEEANIYLTEFKGGSIDMDEITNIFENV